MTACSGSDSGTPKGPASPGGPADASPAYRWSDQRAPTAAPGGTSELSALSWMAVTSGWGPAELDTSNGEQAAGDGHPLSVGGQRFTRGLGVHSPSALSYSLGGRCSSLSAQVGIDDEVGRQGSVAFQGSVVFQVWADGSKLFDSGVVRGGEGARPVGPVDLDGRQELRLVVTDAGDGSGNDHADWGAARLTCQAPATQPVSYSYRPLASQLYPVSEAQGTVVGGKLYTFSGFDSVKLAAGHYTPTDQAYVYDPATDRWAAIASMPLHGATHLGITNDGSHIFLAGGYVANAEWSYQVFGTRAVWQYDPAADLYTRLPDLPAERAAGQLQYLDGKLHYFGGTNIERTQDVGDHYVLDLAGHAGEWTLAAPLPNPRTHLSSAVLGGHIYAIGGQHKHDAAAVRQASVDMYDPATDHWTPRADLPLPRSHTTSATFVLNGRIIVAGGETVQTAVPVSDVTAYDPASDRWSSLTSLPEARMGGVAAALPGGRFLFTAGSNSAGGWLATPAP